MQKPETISKIALGVSIAALALAIAGFACCRCHKKHDGGPHFGPRHEDARGGDSRRDSRHDRDDKRGGPHDRDGRHTDKDGAGESGDNNAKSNK